MLFRFEAFEEVLSVNKEIIVMAKKILIPVDGSKHSRKAIEFAAGIAQKDDSALYLIHVVQNKEIPPEILRYIDDERIDGSLGKISAKLIAEGILKAAQELVKDKGLKIEKAMVFRGDPAEEIVKFARNNKIDVIIIGSRGLGRIKGMLLGSVSSKVCHLAECTCVTVK